MEALATPAFLSSSHTAFSQSLKCTFLLQSLCTSRSLCQEHPALPYPFQLADAYSSLQLKCRFFREPTLTSQSSHTSSSSHLHLSFSALIVLKIYIHLIVRLINTLD